MLSKPYAQHQAMTALTARPQHTPCDTSLQEGHLRSYRGRRARDMAICLSAVAYGFRVTRVHLLGAHLPLYT